MWLENDDEAAMPQLTCGLEGGPHLRRMVRVVIVDRRALKNAEELEPAVRAGEALEGPGHFGEGHAQLQRHGGGGGSVLDVVASWLPEVDPAQLVPGVMQRKGAALTATVVGAVAEAVSDSSGGRFERERPLVIGAKEGDAVGRQRGCEPGDAGLHLIYILEMAGMVGLGVGHDRAFGVV